MYRPNLRRIPQYSLLDGFGLRFFRRGDRKTWLDIWQTVENHERVTLKTFRQSLGYDLPALPRRCLFLISPDGHVIGTATAWYERDHGQRWGRLHWVAIRPEFQGRGLSKPLVGAVMNLMRVLGHRRAFLITQTPRIAAIRTYLRFGFRPDISTDEDHRAWRLVHRHIKAVPVSM
ncbi:MAG: GNAT family N-acetyltransferase [Planctomycetota bacterium]|nr:MAG: GNAT family N-acetyltransferase [Planctomycetota bacterium]